MREAQIPAHAQQCIHPVIAKPFTPISYTSYMDSNLRLT